MSQLCERQGALLGASSSRSGRPTRSRRSKACGASLAKMKGRSKQKLGGVLSGKFNVEADILTDPRTRWVLVPIEKRES
jgi:hypothetical protein